MTLRTLVFLDPTAGFTSEMAAAVDEFNIAKITLSGLAGVALDGGSQLASNFLTPASGSDLATKGYVDAAITGLDWKDSVRLGTDVALPANTAGGSGVGKTLTADANGALSVDSVAVADGDRILVKDEVTGSDNGLYDVTDLGSAGTPYILTRATDADQDAEVTAGLAVFVEEGTMNADTGWLITTDDPITVDTTSISFAQFTGAGFTAGDGLLLTGSVLDVRPGDGIAIDSDLVVVDLTPTPGLEFSTGDLQVLVDPNGGIERVAAGIGALLDGDSLQKSSTGLLSAGLEEDLVANETVTAGDPVAYSATNNEFAQGDAGNDADSRIFGIAEVGITASNPGRIVRRGVATGVLSGATVNTPFFLAAGGGLATTPPAGAGNRVVRMGFAKNASDLEVIIQDLGKKA